MSYTTTNANVNSASWRADQRSAQATRETRIAHLRRWLDHNADLAWTPTYAARIAELARLEAGQC